MKTEYFIGLDLGQSQDPTAIAVLERTEARGEWDSAAFEYRTEVGVRLRHMERLPLGTSYPAVVARVKQVMESRSLAGGKKYLVVDATGVGRPVVDLLEAAGLPCKVMAVTITGGAAEGMAKGAHRVPKRDLIVGLQVMFQAGELEIANGLREGAALVKELSEMRVQMTTAGREKFGAKSGSHDDLVLAVSLACWAAGKAEAGTVGYRAEGPLLCV
jgi:hypothetical protein